MSGSGRKRRKLVYPTLDDVKPLAPVGSGSGSLEMPTQEQRQRPVFPAFLHNALFSEVTIVPHESCPFRQYVALGEPAWKTENESIYLVERPCYITLMAFLDFRFKDFKLGVQKVAVVTGTAGIGKTMFALHAARCYFQRGEFVVLYYANSFWAFTKTNPQQIAKDPDAPEVDPNLLLQSSTVAETGEMFWYGKTDAGQQTQNENKLSQWKASGCAIFIRDPGKEKSLALLGTSGRELYTVSSGQETFLSMVGKSGVPAVKNQRTAELWSGEEFMYNVKLGLVYFATPTPGDTLDLDYDYVMEGYRRYGGCARKVFEFAETLKIAGTPKEDIQHAQLPNETTNAVTKIAEAQAMGYEESTKVKALLFHRSPLGTSFTVSFASPYLGQFLMAEVKRRNLKALNTVVGALSLTTGHQDAYGVLYEEEVHKMISLESCDTKSFSFLGCHEPSKKRVKDIMAKSEVSLNPARASVVYFPGNSLENVRLEGNDSLLQTYFQPLTSHFPTHDSFICCPASEFFEVANSSLKEDKRHSIETTLAKSIVLVGLQMTVSGSDKVNDKPSHTIYGAHLTSELKAFKKILAESHPDVQIHPDVVTIFFSPMESCRKVQAMPVLTATGSFLQTAIQNFPGMAPQYYAIQEVPMIEQLMAAGNA